MKKTLFSLLALANVYAYGQNNYEIDKIPAELSKNASVVIRMEEQVFDLKNPSHATLTYKTAVTILNKNGENASFMQEYYNKFSSIYGLKAAMYDAKGNKIKEYKSSDFKDRSATSDGTMYDDGRMKELDFLNSNYPYTIEYSYTKDYTGITGYPSWYPVGNFGCALEKSSYIFRIPEGMSFKYLKSPALKTDSVKLKDRTEYKWNAENLKAVEYEPYTIGLKKLMPWVSPAPNDFEYDNSKGNIQDWKSLGGWLYSLNSEPQILPAAVKTKVGDLTKNAKSPKEKINQLYQYLQSNTRYVGVQLGIGALKPINADKVAAVNYGDCKALSNYMKTLLKEAGIESNLVVIGHDMPSMNPNFASLNQANHMILCVPLEKDTVWLECTSQHMPANYLANGCSDKNVLLLTSDGGKLVRTPVYKPTDNYQKRKTRVTLDDQGSADITIESSYGCAQFDDHFNMTLMEPTEQRKRLLAQLEIPNLQLNNFSYVQPDKSIPSLKENIQLKSSQLASKGADKMFLTLNLLNRRESVPAKVEDRKTDFSVPYGYHDEDEIIYVIPKGFKVEFVPKEVHLESEFGQYTAKAVVKDDTIIYTRTQTMTNRKYSPDKYSAFVDFYKKVYQADKVKGVLAKVL